MKLPGVQYSTVLVANVTAHGVLPMKTSLLLMFKESKPVPVKLIEDRLLLSIKLTIGVKLLNHWKLQSAEHLDGIPLMLTENFFKIMYF